MSSRSLSQPDERAQALKTIYDGLKMALDGWYLYRLLEDHQANDQGDRAEVGAICKTPAQSDDVELLTTAELARRISYSTRQIQTFKLEGMPFIGEGRNTRFKLGDVIAWLNQRQRTHQEKNHRVSTAGNGRIAQAPIKTRLQAGHRR